MGRLSCIIQVGLYGITRPLQVKEGSRKTRRKCVDESKVWRDGIAHSGNWGRGTQKGMQVASRNWKGKETSSPQEPPEGISPANIFILAP